MNDFPKYIPSKEERDATYGALISKIFQILTRYEETKRVEPEYVNWICFEIQAYSKLYGEDMSILPSQLMLLLSEGIEYAYVRKIVLDSTNFISRLLKKGG